MLPLDPEEINAEITNQKLVRARGNAPHRYDDAM